VHITARTRIKRVLSRLLPDLPQLRKLAYLPKLESWRRERAHGVPLLADGFRLFDFLAAEVVGRDEPLTYLEFGVFEGKSMRHWLGLNSHPDSRFWGFDTFCGLPEDWDFFRGRRERGTFDAHGQLPAIADGRVRFVEGLFQDTLPGFLAAHRTEGHLVVNVDCDLYSSALYVLTRCNDILTTGAIVVFDEFSSVAHEFRALEDYCSAYRRDYDVIAATLSPIGYYGQVAIRMR